MLVTSPATCSPWTAGCSPSSARRTWTSSRSSASRRSRRSKGEAGMAVITEPPGTPVLELDTPALVMDIAKVESNIARMAAFLAGTSCRLRPHVKTHKTAVLAHKQLQAGAIGLTCAKLGEAE